MHRFSVSLKSLYFCIAAGILLMFAWNQAAWATQPPVYDVEIVVFTNKYKNDGGERWDRPDPDAIRPSGFFPEDQFTELAPDFYTLKNISYSLEHSGRHSVLFHRAWRQLAYDKAHAAAYPIHSFSDNGRNSIEGVIKLVRERFLHLDVNLQLMSATQGSKVLYPDAPGNEPAFELNETRRIKSNVLYYFDHPRLGMIARVTPYIPAGASTAEEAAGDSGTQLEAEGELLQGESGQPNPDDDQLTR